MTSETDQLAAWHRGRSSPQLDAPVDEPDLASWAWHRATGAAVAVLVAAAGGLLLAPPAYPGDLEGPLLTGGVAAAVIYTAGPLLALLERRRLRHAAVIPTRLRRFWLLATLAIVCAPTLTYWGIVVTLAGGPLALLAAWAGVAAGLRLPASVGRPLAVAVPVLVVATAFVAAADAGIVDAALALAVLVVVPLGVALLPGLPTAAPLVVFAAGTPATVALLLGPTGGPLAGALTVPWVLATSGVAVRSLHRWRTGRRRLHEAVWAVATGYLAFGSLWFLADRLGYEPAGFGPPFVQLTAVHFTYAGFVALVLAARAWDQRSHDPVAALSVGATAGAPPLVAVGFAAVAALQIVGALLLTVGTYALAWVTLRHVAPVVRPAAAWLLGSSAVSVLVPMLFAVQWAVGANLGTPALSIPQMAATHGVANAVGFSLLGVLGWHLVPRGGPATEHGEDV